MSEPTDTGPIKHLRHAGIRPSQATWDAILALGNEAIPPLLELALDTPLLKGKPPAAYAPLHALRILGKLPAGEQAERLLRTPPIEYEDDDAPFFWEREVPQIVGSWGSSALPGIRAVIADDAVPAAIRGRAIDAVAFAATADSGIRDEVVAELRSQLAHASDPTVAGHIVQALASMHIAEAYPDVLDAYRRHAVDKKIMAAADARQGLLGQGETQLDCVHHSLTEQYNKHGPYTEEQKQAMAEMMRAQQGLY